MGDKCGNSRLPVDLLTSFFFYVEQKLKSVSKMDGGMYRCESSNSVGAPKSCVAQQLKVLDCRSTRVQERGFTLEFTII